MRVKESDLYPHLDYLLVALASFPRRTLSDYLSLSARQDENA